MNVNWDRELYDIQYAEERQAMEREEAVYFAAAPADLDAIPALEATLRTYLQTLSHDRRATACRRIREFVPALRWPATNVEILPPHLAHLAATAGDAPAAGDDREKVAHSSWLSRLETLAGEEEQSGNAGS